MVEQEEAPYEELKSNVKIPFARISFDAWSLRYFSHASQLIWTAFRLCDTITMDMVNLLMSPIKTERSNNESCTRIEP
jgi:hypothetical protein